ncbi:MBL fold metallo-hydrolase [Leptolyngbya sp. 7M]|uniref:MBL fold metallo-hydrolase n=1 Tax=Leptolyngbya sp. 7M TaxID=2812896 RepID=UPI001B8C60C4|nr:MBL fold metallo-hydrolase [Leptolyngbya sp. 7M]QYO65867.1 MBL fold metallo-hydrolase [Leptolyngbya sp. 7M]
MKTLATILISLSLLTPYAFGHATLIKGYPHREERQNFRTEKVAGNVYVLFGNGGNIGLSVGSDGILMIDTQFANVADRIKAEMEKLGSSKPRFIINTHWHGDHTGGNEVFGSDSIIIAHENVRKRMQEMTMFRGQARTPSPNVALPIFTYGAGMNVYFNGERIKAIHMPNGHTDGDTVLYFTSSNVFHLGDDFFVGRFPFVDLESGGTVEGLIKNIGDLILMIPADAKIIPGHGPLATIEDLKEYHQMIIDTSLIVRRGIAAGKNLDQLKAEGFPEKFKEAGSGFIRTDAWIETIYRSYAGK